MPWRRSLPGTKLAVAAGHEAGGHAEAGDGGGLKPCGLGQAAGAEINQADLRRAAIAGGEQDVGRFDVAVQNADLMRGGDGARDAGDQGHALGKRDRGEAALLGRPGRQVEAAERTFDIPGSGLEIPLDGADQIGTLAEGGGQNTAEGGLALEVLETLGGVGELEDARLGRLFVTDQPDAGVGEHALQTPLRPVRDRLARAQAEGQASAFRRRADLDRHADPVADAVHRLDDRAAARAEGGAQLGDRRGQRAFGDGHAWPDGAKQLVLGGDFAGTAEQRVQEAERLGLQSEPLAADTELPAAFVEGQIVQDPDAGGCDGVGHLVHGAIQLSQMLRHHPFRTRPVQAGDGGPGALPRRRPWRAGGRG